MFLFLKAFLIFPALSLLAAALVAAMFDDFLTGAAIGMLIAVGVYILCITQSLKGQSKKLHNHLRNLDLSPDYVANVEASGVAIDLDNRKVFAGNIKTGKLLDFDDIKGVSIEKTDPRNRYTDYNIIIKTMDFDTPSVTVNLRRSDGRKAYEKLRVALDIS
ncbi:hypothetical protein QT231_01280 [Halomonas sp. SpR1]|uniref:hypothetical protein n=1 Tax=Halomonas sp. SpR1 TaxID=3050462 RepID=UPI0027E4342D|nr:hypothetical protein [Halomonas sp. SpR1]MDQ7731311.1 hypothetical protein [Halomonas sp. SpR1]